MQNCLVKHDKCLSQEREIYEVLMRKYKRAQILRRQAVTFNPDESVSLDSVKEDRRTAAM